MLWLRRYSRMNSEFQRLLNKAGLVPHQPLHRFKAEFFRALGHPARLRILELLRERERNVSELQVALDIEASSVSQQLAVLRAKNIVDTRRVGTSVYYSVRDPQIFQLLDVARQIFNNHLIDLQAMLETQAREESADKLDGHRRARPKRKLAGTR
jgi:DNA-binding transcriptional ArsR family regulator